MNKYIPNVIGSQNTCPACQANLIGEDIFKYFKDRGAPEEEALRIAEMYGWTPENPKHFREVIDIETEQYDGVSFYMCPKCQSYWRRFEWTKKEEICCSVPKKF